MRSAVGLVLLRLWILLQPRASAESLPGTADGGFVDECVREHDRARSSVSPPASNMRHMTWDEGLAAIAKAWAERCKFQHNPRLKGFSSLHPSFSSIGENIWTGSPSSFNVTTAVRKWVDEKQSYDYQKNTCSSACGHYTQVVWASSHKVGCAAHLCPGGVINFTAREGVMFVCNYAPAGNVNSERPYDSGGAACSGCTASDRDGWSPAGSPAHAASPALAATSYHYVHILIARPIGLLLTFITAYAVHSFYPDIFCYE